MTPAAQKILTMIEGVTPETPMQFLDEIDLRVLYMKVGKDFDREPPFAPSCFQYTRSIDAQEALRREGWWYEVIQTDAAEFMADVWRVNEKNEALGASVLKGAPCLTEPLARLHAWIQVWGMEGT